MFCIKPYLNETERGKEGGGERRLNPELAARAGRGRGGPGEGRARPAEAPWAPATGWRRGRRLSPAERGSPGRPGSPSPALGTARPGPAAVAPLIPTDRNKRALRSDSQAFMG